MTQQQVFSRRRLFAALGSAYLANACAHARADLRRDFAAKIAAIQKRIGGHVGVYVLDTQSQLELAFNVRTRFAMCSTFKLLLAAQVLRRVDAGTLKLDYRLPLRPEDMLPHAPVTSVHLAEGSMTVEDLCAAIVTVSDNPAANILLTATGGPSALTQFLGGIGDRVTRLDRTELALNANLPGDPRDTTTPQAIAHSMEKVLLGDVLSTRSRLQLIAWLRQSTTGLARLRAGLPAEWQAGDKSGTGANGATNDVMIAWPPGRSAVIGAVYFSESTQSTAVLEQAHAQIGGLVAAAVARQ
jgi:beta-lactamase class A